MADLTLHDGREITFDLNAISITEYRSVFDPAANNDVSDAVVAKASCLTVEEVRALSLVDYHRLAKAFFGRAADPLSDPNSQSASTPT